MQPKDLYVTSRCTVASFSQGKDLAVIGDATTKTATPEEFALAELFAAAPDVLAERDALRAQVAALVEALKQIGELPRYDDNSILEAQRIAGAAIAAAESEAAND